MNNKKLSNNIGITLIEILMAVIVLGAVMSVVTPMIIQSFNIVEDSSVRISQNRLADIMLKNIGDHLKSAVSPVNEENKMNGSTIYEFDAYSLQNGNKKSYKIIKTSDSELEFKENGNLLREIRNVKHFDIIKDNSPLYILELKVLTESGEIINKQLNINARNIAVEDA